MPKFAKTKKKMRTEGKLHMSDTSIPQFAELPRLPTGVVCCQNIFAKNSNITINKVHQIIMKIIRECEMNDAVYIVLYIHK